MRIFFLGFLFLASILNAKVQLGVDRLFQEEELFSLLKDKKIGLVTNHTGLTSTLKPTPQLFLEKTKLVALFSPEHGFKGLSYAGEKTANNSFNGIPIYSLYGKMRRPTPEMLKNIDLLIFDIQDVGVRAYTYATTLFYMMEEAAKNNIELWVLDRPNPINGITVDGPMLTNELRSFLGYSNVAYCHGMTIGELALFFNGEYNIDCKLKIIPMKGWKRAFSFKDTGLAWIPPSPNIPEADTPIFLASTGILGELNFLNIGIGYTLPFKIIGAPWIDEELFAKKLNSQKLPGVFFIPFNFRPFYGAYKGEDCHGVKIVITNPKIYRPLSVEFLSLGILKSLYPQKIEKHINSLPQSKQKLFCEACGNNEMLEMLKKEKYIAWKMIDFQKKERDEFLKKREKYLLY